MAGIGLHIKSLDKSPSEILQGMNYSIENISEDDAFSLIEYREVYDELSGAKINIGMVVRKAIMFYTEALLEKNCLSWKMAFDMALKK